MCRCHLESIPNKQMVTFQELIEHVVAPGTTIWTDRCPPPWRVCQAQGTVSRSFVVCPVSLKQCCRPVVTQIQGGGEAQRGAILQVKPRNKVLVLQPNAGLIHTTKVELCRLCLGLVLKPQDPHSAKSPASRSATAT